MILLMVLSLLAVDDINSVTIAGYYAGYIETDFYYYYKIQINDELQVLARFGKRVTKGDRYILTRNVYLVISGKLGKYKNKTVIIPEQVEYVRRLNK